MGATQPGGVRVVRVAEDRDLRVVVRDIVRVDAGDVRDHQIGRVDPVRGLEAMLGQQRFEFSPYEQVDPAQEDRRHA